ncbi:hypothetical protein [Chitiniphilus shinanonensis]|uniref:hypothetical protein n=1 Tax=Chitiniphilus shinanonensis TaxID=553088 RepID=UPI003060C1C6
MDERKKFILNWFLKPASAMIGLICLGFVNMIWAKSGCTSTTLQTEIVKFFGFYGIFQLAYWLSKLALTGFFSLLKENPHA